MKRYPHDDLYYHPASSGYLLYGDIFGDMPEDHVTPETWLCEYCESLNHDFDLKCVNCGAAKREAK